MGLTGGGRDGGGPHERRPDGRFARRVGVSRAAVSFVLNNRPDASISDATRRKILDAAAELRYRPHAGARALATAALRLCSVWSLKS